jgi:hypothetical protein
LKRLCPVQELKIDGDVCRLVLGVQFELERLIPVSLDVIRGCVAERSIGALDFYLWLMSRAHQQRPRLHHELSGEICPPWSRTVQIPVFGEGGVFEQLGSQTREVRRARQYVKEWYGLLRSLWPDCPHQLDDKADVLTLLEAS